MRAGLTIAALLCPLALSTDCRGHTCTEEPDVTSLLQVSGAVSQGSERPHHDHDHHHHHRRVHRHHRDHRSSRHKKKEHRAELMEEAVHLGKVRKLLEEEREQKDKDRDESDDEDDEQEALRRQVERKYNDMVSAPLKQDETRTLVVEYRNDTERYAAETFTNFIAKHSLSIELWESHMFDKSGNEHDKLPSDDEGAWPLTFVFSRRDSNSTQEESNPSELIEETDEETADCTPDSWCHGTAPFCGGSIFDCDKSIGEYPMKFDRKCPAGGGATCWYGYKIQCQKCGKDPGASVERPTPKPLLKILKEMIPKPWKIPAPAPPAPPAPKPGTIIKVEDALKALKEAEEEFKKAHGDYVNSTGKKHTTYLNIEKFLAVENSAKYNYTWFRNEAINFAARKTHANQTAQKLQRMAKDAKVEEEIHSLAAQNMKIQAENARENVTFHQKELIEDQEALDYYRQVYDNKLHTRNRAQRELWAAQAYENQKKYQAKLVSSANNAVMIDNEAIERQAELAASKEKAYMESSGLKDVAEVPAWVGYR